MRLVEQWTAIEQGLDPRWSAARLVLEVADGTTQSRALALLAPASPGRRGTSIHFAAARSGGGVGPEAVRRLLLRLDGESIEGTLELLAAEEAQPVAVQVRTTLAAAWDAALAPLPADWSDLLCELELTSSDHVERAVLLLAPINPVHDGIAHPHLRFRAARTAGYGASAGMVRRCLARLDEEGFPGDLRIVRALSDTHPVGTQGPVWYVGGKAV
jgi:hypothetical protein